VPFRRPFWLPRLVALALWSAAALYAQDNDLPTAAEIDSILRELSAITGFRIHHRLEFEMVTRDQVNRFLKDQIRRSVKPDEIRAEETTLRMFGFVPADFDLKKNTIDLLTEQAAAFYDFHRKKLFISDWAARNMRDEALVHELGHALADQNFPLEKFLGKVSDDSEASLARESIVEGQAEWLMIELALRRNGKTLADPDTARQYLLDQAESAVGDKQYPVFSNAPLYIRRTLMFPYEAGQRFQQAVFIKEGARAFADVFRHPPETTAQILHPERYFENIKEVLPDLPKPAPQTRIFVGGVVGELDESVLLEQYVGESAAAELAPKLRGASYRIDEPKSKTATMLVYASSWPDEETARRYFDAYRKVLSGKWKHLEIAADAPDRVAGRSEEGFFLLVRNKSTVLAQEGYPDPL
jgi:hypothetical protein